MSTSIGFIDILFSILTKVTDQPKSRLASLLDTVAIEVQNICNYVAALLWTIE